ncbi:MAG TPA: hypothetical protein VGP93_10630 [Polyangiaceae bacterium]|jgi:hypothetical protein|nr:hypothetical protein [Polyangiaceae bacterium]
MPDSFTPVTSPGEVFQRSLRPGPSRAVVAVASALLASMVTLLLTLLIVGRLRAPTPLVTSPVQAPLAKAATVPVASAPPASSASATADASESEKASAPTGSAEAKSDDSKPARPSASHRRARWFAAAKARSPQPEQIVLDEETSKDGASKPASGESNPYSSGSDNSAAVPAKENPGF